MKNTVKKSGDFARIKFLSIDVIIFLVLLLGTWFFLLTKANNSLYLDDAMITMHCVKNALSGNGLVFNTGERVMAYSNPGYVIPLFTLGKLGISPIAGAYIIFLASSMGLALALGGIMNKAGVRELGPLVCLVLFHSQEFWHSVKGMETSLMIFLGCLAFWLLSENRPKAGAIFAGWAGLCRPDAVVIPMVFIIFLVYSFIRTAKKKEKQKYLIAGGIIVGIGFFWVLFSLFYYGSILPNTVSAKKLQLLIGVRTLWQSIWQRYVPQNPFWCILAIPSIFVFTRKKTRNIGFLLCWGIANIILLLLGRAPYYHWYLIPFIFSLLSLGFLGVVIFIKQKVPEKAKRWISPGIAMIIMILSLIRTDPGGIKGSINPQTAGFKSAPIEYIARHSKKGDIVATGDVGFCGYYSNLYVLDTQGLLQKEVHPFLERGDNLGIFQKWRPQWIFKLFSFNDARSLYLNYSKVDKDFRNMVFHIRKWEPEEIWNSSPDLRKSVEKGERIVFMDWPRIARDFGEMKQFILSRNPGMPPPITAQSGTMEGLIELGAVRIFFPGFRWDIYKRRIHTEQVLSALREKYDPDKKGSLGLTAWRADQLRSWENIPVNGLKLCFPEDPNKRYWETKNRDPFIIYNNRTPKYPVRGLLIKYSIESPATAWRPSKIFFSVPSDKAFTEKRGIPLVLQNDGKTHVAYYDLSDAPLPPKGERIANLRWDPVSLYIGPRVRLYFIIFCGESPSD